MFRTIFAFFSSLGIIGAVAYFALLFALIIGYIANLIQIASFALSSPQWAQIEPDAALWAAKVIGLFFSPLGAILGWYGM